jgi:hypothetical protein
MASAEIHSIQTVSGQQPRMRRLPEEAGQTFLPGTPVQIAAGDGGIKAWDGVTVAFGIAGFSKEFGNNLAALGVTPTAAVNPSPQPSTGQAVPFQPLAVSISRPLFRDGRQGFEVAVADTVFLGQVGPAQFTLATDVGKQFGMTLDADGHWFVDKTKLGAAAVVEVVRLDPNDQGVIGVTTRGVYFIVLPAAAQLVA